MTCTPLTEHDYGNLAKSFVNRDVADRAMLRRVTSGEGEALLDRHDGGDYAGIVFPYMWPGEAGVRQNRLRRDKPDVELREDGTPREKGKYLSKQGTSNMLYLVPGTPAARLRDIALPVAITEGEKKTLALEALSVHGVAGGGARFLPVGLAGVWNWRGNDGTFDANAPNESGSAPIPDLTRIEWAGRSVYVVFDSNATTNNDVRRARMCLAQELRKRRARIYYVNIPQMQGVNGVDDLLASLGPDAVLDLFNRAELATDVSVPPGFEVLDSGVYAYDESSDDKKIWICSRLDVRASSRSQQNEDWGQLLSFADKDGHHHEWLMPMSLLASDGSEYRGHLLSRGLAIAPVRKARELLTKYIQSANPQARVRCVKNAGWHGDAFVLPDETIGAHGGEPVLFQAASGAKHSLGTAGSVSEWRDSIGRYCSGNSRLVFAVACAFAGPLLKLVGEHGGGFHFRGTSSTGKTTALLVAGSVWGGGGNNGFVQTWRTTANGLEAVAEIHNHGLLCLDELGQADPKEAGEIAYALANGSGKQRMTRTIGARPRLEWELLFLSSGETSLADHVQIAGRRTRAGQEVRLCDLDADAGAGLGLFENIHGFANPSEFARQLGERARVCYGFPIRAFLTALTSAKDSAVKTIGALRDEFLKQNVSAGASGEVHRAASRFAVVAAAGELATAAGITGWRKDEALAAATTVFSAWVAGRGTKGSGDEETMIRQVRAFIEAHGASRFLSMKPRIDLDGSLISERAPNRAGFRNEKGGEAVAYFCLPEAFRREVCAGFDPKTVAKVLAARGYLTHDKDRWDTKATLPEFGKTRVYAIKACIMGSPNAVVGSAASTVAGGDSGDGGDSGANLQQQQGNQPMGNGPMVNDPDGAAGDSCAFVTVGPVPSDPADASATGDMATGIGVHCIEVDTQGVPVIPSVPTMQGEKTTAPDPIPTMSKNLGGDLDLEL